MTGEDSLVEGVASSAFGEVGGHYWRLFCLLVFLSVDMCCKRWVFALERAHCVFFVQNASFVVERTSLHLSDSVEETNVDHGRQSQCDRDVMLVVTLVDVTPFEILMSIGNKCNSTTHVRIDSTVHVLTFPLQLANATFCDKVKAAPGDEHVIKWVCDTSTGLSRC